MQSNQSATFRVALTGEVSMNSLFDNITETLTGKRKKRDKFTLVPTSTPATIPTPQALKPTSKEEPSMASITFHPGSGKSEKAAYRLGKAFVPAAVVTRILQETEGKSDQRKTAILGSRLEKKYSDFLEALDKADMTFLAALEQFKSLKPVKASGGTGQRTGKTEKTAEALSKSICKRFKGTPEEMIQKFLEVVNGAEFKKELVDILKAYQKNFGTGPTGFTKTSNRKGNPAAIKALAKSRAAKKK